MKGCRKCQHSPVGSDDSVCYMAGVNKGAQKIMSELPDQLTAMFTWTLATTVFVLFLVTTTYVIIGFDSPAPSSAPEEGTADTVAAALHHVSKRESCSASADSIAPERTAGPAADTDCRATAWTALMDDVDAGDVHYVFANGTTHVPRLLVCSLESVLRAVGNRSRVNVFVVHGIGSERPTLSSDEQPVSLLSSLAELQKATYGGDRLNVVHVRLAQCLECSPFRGMDLSNSPGFAMFAVQLVLLWQFGGTVLDTGVVAIRGQVYRASGSAVEYDDRTISSAVACHASVYNAMTCARDHGQRHGQSLAPNATQKIMAMAGVAWTGRACGYYAVAGANDTHLDGLCPDVMNSRVSENVPTHV